MDEKLPQPPPLTPAQMEINNDEQLARAQRFKDSISAGNLKFARASAIVNEIEASFGEFVSLKKRKSLLTSIQIQQYADALATLGDYKTAHQYDNTQGYDKLDAAVWRPDDETCKCKPVKRLEQDGTTTTFDTMFVSRKIFSIKHNREVDLLTCNKCFFKNAK